MNQRSSFLGAGDRVIALCRSGNITEATKAFNLHPDFAGATALMSALAKKGYLFILWWTSTNTSFLKGLTRVIVKFIHKYI
jgi:hypothetical protein